VEDIIAGQRLGFPAADPYLSPRGRDVGRAMKQGVNYASAGCGILDGTSMNSVSHFLPKIFWIYLLFGSEFPAKEQKKRKENRFFPPFPFFFLCFSFFSLRHSHANL
jgi:hypothetical protein